METVSTLEARSGIFGMLDVFVMSQRGGREERERLFVCSGQQQNVSLFHNLQLRFSRRFPSSSAHDAFENTVVV